MASLLSRAVQASRAALAAPAVAADLTRAAIGQVIETAGAVASVPVRVFNMLGQAELLVNQAGLAIGEAGATNAGLLAAAILATNDPALAERLKAFREAQTAGVAERPS
jgi:phosphoribosylcarboxyaminoimidazole (NCAIR) mutase